VNFSYVIPRQYGNRGKKRGVLSLRKKKTEKKKKREEKRRLHDFP